MSALLSRMATWWWVLLAAFYCVTASTMDGSGSGSGIKPYFTMDTDLVSTSLIPTTTTQSNLLVPMSTEEMLTILEQTTTSSMSPTETYSSPPLVTSSSATVLTATLSPISTATLQSTQPLITPMPSNTVTTASPPFDITRLFQDYLIYFAAGGALILILLLIVIVLCCCCVCSKVRKRRRNKYSVHHAGLSISNPTAATSLFSNGSAPGHYHHGLANESSEALPLDDYDLLRMEQEQQYGLYRHGMFQETDLDDKIGEPSQVQHSQMSAMTDLFGEGTLPKLSPFSYSSQRLPGGSVYHGLSVDHIESAGRHPPSLGMGGSSLSHFPNSSPSLRVPTRMALKLQNEESKSAHGSKASIHGSKTSFQGSKQSIFGSKTSSSQGGLQGSRAHFHSSSLSREISSSLLSGHQEEEDNLSLPLSGQTISPQFQENSMDLMEVPTRDSPLGGFPVSSSRSIGYGKQDFASLTCIPNQLAIEGEVMRRRRDSLPVQQSAPPYQARRKSLQDTDFGALTTLRGSDIESEVRPQKMTETIPEEGSEENKARDTSLVGKKPRSRAMSRLEKLTSLDYIRASLRLKKKKVSFENSTPTATSENSKNKRSEATIVENKGALNEQESPHQTTNGGLPISPPFSSDVAYRPRHHSTLERSPDFLDEQRPLYSEYPYVLSQPTYYGSHMIQPPYQQHGYPQLSQQYYPQMGQGYMPHPYSYAVPTTDPFRRSYVREGGRYPEMETPDFSDITTPEHERYIPKERRTTPDQLLEDSTRPNGGYLPPRLYGAMDGYEVNRRAPSPDSHTESSVTSAPHYLARSPDLFGDYPTGSLPRSSHYMDSFVSDMYHQMPGRDHYTEGPANYPPEVFYSPTRSELYEPGKGYPQHRRDHSFDNELHRSPEHYLSTTSPRHQAVKTGRHPTGRERRFSGISESSTSDRMTDTATVSSKAKVSWSTEVIEYTRTPSDESDYDLNHL